jgi:hypothetical protein
MIPIAHLNARASRPMPAEPGASPALTPGPPDAAPPPSDRRPGLALDQRSPTRRSAAPTTSRVPLRRKRPAGTRGSGDIDKPSAVTGRDRSIGDRAASEIDAPGPRLTPTCGGRLRRPRTEEWPLPDHHPRSRRQLGALDPRSPITEEGLARGSWASRAVHGARRCSWRAAHVQGSAWEIDGNEAAGQHPAVNERGVVSSVAGHGAPRWHRHRSRQSEFA